MQRSSSSPAVSDIQIGDRQKDDNKTHQDGSLSSNHTPFSERTRHEGSSESSRNKADQPVLQHLEQHPSLHRDHQQTSKPFSLFNTTNAHFWLSAPSAHATNTQDSTNTQDAAHAMRYKWTSRNNRKGRHAIAINRDALPHALHDQVPSATSSLKEICHGIWRMATEFPIFDISYDVATVFTIGSVVWIINAFFAFLPLVQPSTEFNNEALYGGGISAFIGATIFVWGSILLMLEAVNANRTGCFGWALERVYTKDTEKASDTLRLRPSESVCTHHHRNHRNLVGKGLPETRGLQTNESSSGTNSWDWWPSMAELRVHYVHEIGFAASFTQLLAASVFWIAGLTSLPGIYDRMSRPIIIIFYWTPQVIGGTGFIISGALFMLETQSRWYKPAFGTLGWWIGAWNLIGGIGFTLCPAFGYDESSWAVYQASLSTFWGSWAFLIGSVIQWYESLGKFPVEVR